MEHNEAVAALESLPEVARIEVVRLKPTDVIVVECDHVVSHDMAERITASLRLVWPNHKTVVCDSRMRLKVVEGTPTPEQQDAQDETDRCCGTNCKGYPR